MVLRNHFLVNKASLAWAICLLQIFALFFTAHEAQANDCRQEEWKVLKFTIENIDSAFSIESPDAIVQAWKKNFPPIMQTQTMPADFIILFNEKIIQKFSQSPTQSVHYSGEHLVEISQAIIGEEKNLNRLNALGFDRKAFLLGTYSSDKGKDASYIKFLILKKGDPEATPAALAESERLIDLLKGKATPTILAADGQTALSLGTKKSVEAMQELFAELGLPKSYFNPAASNEQIKDVLRKVTTLQGFLHELPGLRDLSYLLELGYISKADFKNALRHDLGHNGPNFGFWRVLSQGIISKQAQALQATDDLAFILQNGVFAGKHSLDMNGVAIYQLNYPNMSLARFGEKEALAEISKPTRKLSISEILGMDIGPVLHQISDRLSVATRNGFIKIAHELNLHSPTHNGDPIAGVFDILVKNPEQTLEQTNEIGRQIVAKHTARLLTIEKAASSGKISAQEKIDLFKLVNLQVAEMKRTLGQANGYISSYQKFLNENFVFSQDKKSLRIIFPDKSVREITYSPDTKSLSVTSNGKTQTTTRENFILLIKERLDLADAKREIDGLESSATALYSQ